MERAWRRASRAERANEMFDYLGTAPEEAGVAVLAPNSRGNTWDAISDSFGPDVKFLNRALELVLEMLAIDARRVVIGGFSDGALCATEILFASMHGVRRSKMGLV